MFLFGGKEKEQRKARPRFKQATSLEERIIMRQKFQEKYPKDRYALVVLEDVDQLEPSSKNFNIIGIENNFNVLMLHAYIRKVLKMDNRQSFFLKIRNQIRRTSDNIGELFKRYAEEDGFLYIQIKKENIF